MIARPKFDQFKLCTKILAKSIENEKNYKPIEIVAKLNKGLFPIGFQFKQPIKNISYEMIHLRDFETEKLTESKDILENCLVTQIFFPLIAIIIPYWLNLYKEPENKSKPKIKDKYYEHSILLLSGCGDSRDFNFSPENNSTDILSRKILSCFIKTFYPHIRVIHRNSGPGIFHYSDNVRFVSNQIRPGLEENRAEAAKEYGKEWPNYFHVTLSLTDGTPARVGSITEGLRIFKPDLLHVWSLKTLWHAYPKIEKICDEDVEFHTFNQLEVQVPKHFKQLNQQTRLIVEEIITWRKKFVESQNIENEIEIFWLRKTKQPILSVLMIKKPGKERKIYRAMNMEVSMPTGSLCAERNAIGTALSQDPSLKREDFKMIAVLSLNNEIDIMASDDILKKIKTKGSNLKCYQIIVLNFSLSKNKFSEVISKNISTIKITWMEKKKYDLNPRSPCGACTEWLNKIAEINPNFKIITFANEKCNPVFVRTLL